MKPTLLTSILLPTLITAQSSSRREGNCSVFDWDNQNPYYQYSRTPQRISGASSCPENSNSSHFCALIADGDLQVQWKQNSSLQDASWNSKEGVQSFFFNIISEAIQPWLDANSADFNNSVIGVIDNVATLEPGSAGYLNITPLMRCFQGTFENCTGVDDGLGVEACAPVVSVDQSGLKIIHGNVSIQNVSEADVGKYRDPFANQSRGAAGKSFFVRLEVLGVVALGAVGMLVL